MSERTYVELEDRGVLRVSGPDARTFLQGLISNDVDRVSPERAIYAAFLTAQGKFLHDFFVCQIGDDLFIDCEGARRDDLKRRMSIYRLRAKATLEPADDLSVFALIGAGAADAAGLPPEAGRAAAFAGGAIFVDPRVARMGARAVLPRDGAEAALAAAGFTPAPEAAYERLRLEVGVPDGSRDMDIEKAILLENNFEELHGVDWDKGCYVGQELTARTKYRGTIRKRLLPVRVDGPLPAPGTPVMLDGKAAGEMRSGRDGRALALLRLDAVERAGSVGTPLVAGEARITPEKPDWATF